MLQTDQSCLEYTMVTYHEHLATSTSQGSTRVRQLRRYNCDACHTIVVNALNPLKQYLDPESFEKIAVRTYLSIADLTNGTATAEAL